MRIAPTWLMVTIFLSIACGQKETNGEMAPIVGAPSAMPSSSTPAPAPSAAAIVADPTTAHPGATNVSAAVATAPITTDDTAVPSDTSPTTDLPTSTPPQGSTGVPSSSPTLLPDAGTNPALGEGITDASTPLPPLDAGPPAPNPNPLPELGGPAPDIEVFSHVETLEMAPVVLAADNVYPGNLTVRSGGMADLFNENQALVATNADTVALRFSLDNPNLRIVFTVCESYYRIVARRSAGIETLADLAGKNVSAINETSAAYFLHRMLATVGLSESDINLNPGGGFATNVPQQLANGSLDAVSAWEPDPQRAVDLLGDDAIEFRDRAAYREMVNVNTTAENLADPDKRAAIVAFVKTLIVAADRVTNDPQSVWPIMEREMGFAPDLIERSWFIQEYKGTLAPDLLDVMTDEEVWLAARQGRQPRPRDELATLIDTSILEEALAP